MNCPTLLESGQVCGKISTISRVSIQSSGYVRYRHCANGHKLKTIEIVVPYNTHGGVRHGEAHHEAVAKSILAAHAQLKPV